MVLLFGAWHKADAVRMEAAVRYALHVYQEDYMDKVLRLNQPKREHREYERGVWARRTGKKGTAKEGDDKLNVDNSLKSMSAKIMLSLLSFCPFLQWIFGRDFKLAEKLADAQRQASNEKEAPLNGEFDSFSKVFTEMVGGDIVAG